MRTGTWQSSGYERKEVSEYFGRKREYLEGILGETRTTWQSSGYERKEVSKYSGRKREISRRYVPGELGQPNKLEASRNQLLLKGLGSEEVFLNGLGRAWNDARGAETT